jgi:hypothetical protein
VSVPIDPVEFVDSIRDGLGQVPGVVFAAILLGGPTALWLLYRFIVVPRTSRFRPGTPSTLWVCPNCRSANEIPQDRCYRCGYERDSLRGIEVVYAEPEYEEAPEDEIPLPGIFPGVPVGPGHPLAPAAGLNGVGEHQDEPVGERGEGMTTEGVPVGPGRPVAAPPRRLAVADRHPGQPAPLVEPGEQPDELERTTTGPERSR